MMCQYKNSNTNQLKSKYYISNKIEPNIPPNNYNFFLNFSNIGLNIVRPPTQIKSIRI